MLQDHAIPVIFNLINNNNNRLRQLSGNGLSWQARMPGFEAGLVVAEIGAVYLSSYLRMTHSLLKEYIIEVPLSLIGNNLGIRDWPGPASDRSWVCETQGSFMKGLSDRTYSNSYVRMKIFLIIIKIICRIYKLCVNELI